MNTDWFAFGEPVDLARLPEAQAIFILGRPVYEALRHTQQPGRGHYRVASVDRAAGIVTVQWEGVPK